MESDERDLGMLKEAGLLRTPYHLFGCQAVHLVLAVFQT